MVRGKVEILSSKLVHDRVDFDDRGVNAMLDQCCGRGPDSESAVLCQFFAILFLNAQIDDLHDKCLAVVVQARSTMVRFNQTNSLEHRKHCIDRVRHFRLIARGRVDPLSA